MPRLSPDDWFAAAREILKERGHAHLTIRGMGEALGVSTGSFYHHFTDRDDFVHRFFQDWGARSREQIGSIGDFGEGQLEQLNRRVNQLIDHRLEAAIRAWGLFDPLAEAEIRAFDLTRRSAFIEYYTPITGTRRARDLADLHLCALAGAQFLYLDNPKRLRAIGNFVNRTAGDAAR